MPTIRERIRCGFQQQAERLGAALATLLTPMASHNFVPRALHMLRSIGWIAASLPVCLAGATVGLASVSGSSRAGSRELFQNDYLLARKPSFGAIRSRVKGMFV
jgi:hypothetical protein